MTRHTLSVLVLALGLPAVAQEPARFMARDRHERYRAMIPTFADPGLEEIRRHPRLLLFTDAEMPPAFQAANRGRLGVFSAKTQFLVGTDGFGQANLSFPWRRPFGLEFSEGWTSFRFLLLPEGRPIEWYGRRQPGDRQAAVPITWDFPEGSVLGEVLQLTTLGAGPVAFEVRVRSKRPAGWQVDVFRPYRDRDELDTAVAMLAGADQAAAFLGRREHEDRVWDQARVRHLLREARYDILPSLEKETVGKLLATPFASVKGREWVPGGLAPDTLGVNIVPPHYSAAFIPVTANTCASCHRTAGKNANQFGFAAPPGWDEWVRGSATDDALGFHIFDAGSVSRSGQFLTITLNPVLTRAGLLKHRGN
jgi:hypothetical protein